MTELEFKKDAYLAVEEAKYRDVPKDKYMIAVFRDEKYYEEHNGYPEDFDSAFLCEKYVFDTPEEFLKKWYELDEGDWYWCFDKGELFCSGAIDPCDIEMFEEHFDISFENATGGNKENKIEIDLGYVTLVAEKNSDPNYKEIFLCLNDKNGGFVQDLVVIGSMYHYDDNGLVLDKGVSVKVYSDKDNEDYTHEFSIDVYEPENSTFVAYLRGKHNGIGFMEDESSYDSKEEAIAFATARNWDGVYDGSTGEIIWEK